MRQSLLSRVIPVLIVLLVGTVVAHHGWSNYDQDQPLTLTGIVVEVLYENPHVEIMLELLSEGEPTGEVWEVALPPPSRAQRLGLTTETLQEDMVVTVEGFPHRSEAGEMRATSILLGEEQEPIALR